MPDSLKGLAHGQKDSICRQLHVRGIKELSNYTNELESGRIFPVKTELLVVGEISEQR